MIPGQSQIGSTDPRANTSGGTGRFGVGTDKAQTGFGRRIVPAMHGEMWSNPEALIQHWLKFNRFPTNTGGSAVAQQQADNLGILWLLMQGKEANKGYNNFFDWTDKYMDRQFTPGAGNIGTRQIMDSIFTRDKDNPVFNHLYGADLTPSDQVRNTLSATRYGLEGNMPAPVRDATLTRMQDIGNSFVADRATTGATSKGTFADFARANGFSPEDFGSRV